MNTANLQLAGLYAVVSALVNAIREKGQLSAEKIHRTLAHAEDASAADQARSVQLSDSNVVAMCFPARYLRIANKTSVEGRQLRFRNSQRWLVRPSRTDASAAPGYFSLVEFG